MLAFFYICLLVERHGQMFLFVTNKLLFVYRCRKLHNESHAPSSAAQWHQEVQFRKRHDVSKQKGSRCLTHFPCWLNTAFCSSGSALPSCGAQPFLLHMFTVLQFGVPIKWWVVILSLIRQEQVGYWGWGRKEAHLWMASLSTKAEPMPHRAR